MTEEHEPDTHSGVLRSLKIYATSNGQNGGFSSHLFTYRVEDEQDNLVYTNADAAPELVDGNQTLGFHGCLLDWLWRWPHLVDDRIKQDTLNGIRREPLAIVEELRAPRQLTIITTHTDGVYEVYTHQARDLVASTFHKKSGKLFANHEWILQVLLRAEENRTVITCRQPESIHEEVTLAIVRNEGARRWNRSKVA